LPAGDLPQPLQGFEDFPRIAARLAAPGRGEPEGLAREVIRAPPAVIVGIDDLAAGDLAGDAQTPFAGQPKPDVAQADLAIIPIGLFRQGHPLEADLVQTGWRQ